MHDTVYACLAVGFYYPYMVQGGVHVCLVQYGTFYKYNGRLLFMHPLCVVVAHSRMYDIIELR